MSGSKYTVNIPNFDGQTSQFEVKPGQLLFGLGANGTGKSSFVSLLAKANSTNVSRLTGNREITLSSAAVGITGATRNQYEQFFENDLRDETSRYYSSISRNLTDSILYDLKEAESTFMSLKLNSLIEKEEDSNDEKKELKNIRKELSPLKKVEDILKAGGLNFVLSYDARGNFIAKKNSLYEIDINMLSDGERAALLMAAKVITVQTGNLVLIDEPERHLHRSISSPLILSMIEYRSDCSFMIVTHDLSLPRDFPHSKILLFREFKHPNKWRLEQIENLSAISEDVAEAVLGAKDKILFVEGQKNSLDFSLYSILYENCTVQAQESCSAVISMTKSVRASSELHRIEAYGIIDNDGLDVGKIVELNSHNVFPIKVHSVEGLYYHPDVLNGLTKYLENMDFVIPEDFEVRMNSIILDGFSEKKSDFIADMQVRKIREITFQKLPKKRDLSSGLQWSIGSDSTEVKELFEYETAKFEQLIVDENIEGLVTSYNIKKTGIPDKISILLGLASRNKYEDLVRSRARKDKGFKKVLTSLVGINI